ncbi:uncharacterized protein N7496_005361 [Penicillium cataractarum]|uniref:Nucleoside phosphorylase domain-containing protein n=1 Tax=Penicillium cataractarum TaxID=2100454 RepID=A0A9W9VDG8_9EURO|nr:uncharacterized protein N7496_005361 [Penicillium cataractarum]KAJ5377952.1 hypothetical protein N7496_005361 [Penicillium cataractarum]
MDGRDHTDEDGTESDPYRPPKRQKTFHHDASATLGRGLYTVAWICALHIEMAAALAMLDEVHDPLHTYPDDSNTYKLGRIKQHNVVIACLPAHQYGTNNAANVVTNLKRTFPSIRAGLMVGIGGGVPSKADIRLGDVVVGTRVMQYDLGKLLGDGRMQRTAIPKVPHQLLGTAVSALRSKHELEPSQIPSILKQKLGAYHGYGRPSSPDRLFCVEYDHENSNSTCDDCDQSKLISRCKRGSGDIMIHYGAIASGNQVVKDGRTRDSISRQLDVVCFEMEAAGLMDTISCLVIRGICDYADTHKSKEWQRYAAATAAAYARELLEELPVTEGYAKAPFLPDPQENRVHERRQRLLESLRFEQIDSRKLTIKTAHAKTCKWFLSHPDYKTWLDPSMLSQHHGFLWISGKPGAGKSTIMKFAYTNTKNKARRQGSVVASFFFNARGEYLEKSVFGMYRSLLLQLLEGYPILQSVLDESDLIHDQNGCPSLNVLKDVFCDAVLALGTKSFTCFVDALDECDEQQVVEMVQYFEDLAEQSASRGAGHSEDLEAYVSSHLQIEDPAIIDELQPQLLGKAAGVFMWVVLVVDILNKEHRRGGLSLRRRLAEIPSDLSELFKDILRRDNENVEDLLLCVLWILYAKRPLQPKEFYHALWSGLSLKGLVDDRPPTSEDPDSKDSLNRFNRCVISSSKGLAEITTKSKKPIVQFIHESVRDFLIKDKGLQQMWPELGLDPEGPSHEMLKQCCNLYTNHVSPPIVAKLQDEEDINREHEVRRPYPFLEYACQHIFYHSDAAASSVPQDEFLDTFQTYDWILINNLLEKLMSQTYRSSASDASLDYILADIGCPNLIRARLKHNPDVHRRSPAERYKYPLFAALAAGNKETVAALLNTPSHIYNGEDLTEGLNNRKDMKAYGRLTPLTWAAQEGRKSIVELLLLQDVDINEEDWKMFTPLVRAITHCHEEIATLLITSGADVNICGPLHAACWGGLDSLVGLLLDEGAEIDQGYSSSSTPLIRASEGGHLRTVMLLIERGATLNFQDEHGVALLLGASTSNCLKLAQFLIKNGVNVNAKDEYGISALSRASQSGSEAVLQLLADSGADVHARSDKGSTPLFRSANARIANILITRGLEVNMKDEGGDTPLIDAVRRSNDVLKHPRRKRRTEASSTSEGSNFSARTIIANEYDGVVKTLIEHGADVNVQNRNGQKPLMMSLLYRNTSLAKLLIEQGADVNIETNGGETPLLIGIRGMEEEIVRLLIERGAEVNARDDGGNTPLLMAVHWNREVIMRLLIERGADVNVRDAWGSTPLSIAAKRADGDAIVQLLIERGADVNARDDDGNTPLSEAMKNANGEAIVQLLIENGAVDSELSE